MCIIFYSLVEPEYSLVLASNRDEFLSRPTTSATFHSFSPSLSSDSDSRPRYLSGLDLTGGGTWLGISLPVVPGDVRLRFATLTNFTEVPSGRSQPSRGALVKDYLESSGSLEEYLERVEATKSDYAGFNLLFGELRDSFRMGYVSNRSKHSGIVEGSGGLSNTTLSSGLTDPNDWPKIVQGRSAFESTLSSAASSSSNSADAARERLVEGLWGVMSTPASSPITHRSHLRHTILVKPVFLDPSTPLPAIPPPFPSATSVEEFRAEEHIEGQGGYWYSTRVQTVILIRGSVVYFYERDAYVLDNGQPRWSGEERRFQFEV